MNKKQSSKKTRSAVGIKYEHQSNKDAPKIIAKGYGDLAEEIIALARENGVLIHEDPYLSEFLANLDLGQQIPQEFYHVIAELISFSYVLQGKFPDSWAGLHGKISKEV